MNFKTASTIILLLAFFGHSATFVYSQTKSILQLADEYSLVLREYEKQTSRRSVESVVRKGQVVGQQLEELEALSETDYALLEKKMKGFTVNRDEIVYINPDLKFFAELSKTHGTNADIAFFALMRQIKPENVWAAYIEPQTDYSGCTIYGKGLLTNLYGRAVQFKKNYPKAYTSDIAEEINKILEEFPVSRCACGNRESVLKEYRLFIKKFPKDKNTPQIKKRLTIIEKKKDFRFNCQSG
ncbi:MAG: hypothetical protein ABJA66_15795 [Actinomycetota bacterium]